MSRNIEMTEIPFAPVDLRGAPVLSDTVPPTAPPPAPAPYKRAVAHRLIAWRHDNGLTDTRHDTLESAQAAASALHWAVYWKYAIMCGRDMVAREFISEPAEA